MTDDDPERQADGDGTDEDHREDEGSPGGLKEVLDGADEGTVNDGTGGHPRMTWSSVTDAGGSPPSTDDEPRSGFQFDLGGALARIAGGPEVPPPQREEAVPPADVEHRAERPSVATEPTQIPTPAVEDEAAPVRPSMAPWESVVDEPTDAPAAAALPTRGAPPVEDTPAGSVPAEAPTPDSPSVAAPAAAAAAAALPAREPSSVEQHDIETDYPRRTPGAHLEAQMRTEPPEAAPRPERPERAESSRPVSSASVFDDGAGGVGGADQRADGIPGVPTLPGAPAGGSIPVLPASNPAAPPPVIEPVHTSTSTNDINALRSTQLRQSKQQRQGKLIGRLLLAVVLIGGLIAAALVFGRSLLFTTEWDAELTPVVNEVEAARGAEFADTVPLQVLPAAEYGELLRAATIGDAWVEQVPHWRALGLATGTVTAESVGASLAASTVAFYDPTSDTIYRLETAGAEGAQADLRVALEQAFDRQATGVPAEQAVPADQPSFTGVSTLDSIAARSVDHWLASGGSVGERRPADQSLPLPIAYELSAVDNLGEAVLTSVGVDPSTVSVGEPLPDAAAGVLDDEPTSTAAALLLPGDTALAAPTALGTDDWSLVWAARLPVETVDRLVAQVTADSYRPIERGGLRCFTAVFETADATAGSSTFVSLLSWVSASPSTAQAVASQLSETRVQLEACDPGAESGIAANEGAADQLVSRQIARLSN